MAAGALEGTGDLEADATRWVEARRSMNVHTEAVA